MAYRSLSATFHLFGVENDQMIRAYIVEHDIGFAPNPFFGVCTLATCKPEIRWHTSIGEWVVGIGSIADGIRGRMVFAMKVEEALTFEKYWNDEPLSDEKAELPREPEAGARRQRLPP